MTLSIKLAGATFTDYFGIASLPQNDLVGDYIFGVDAETSIINHADRATPMTANGTIAYDGVSATVNDEPDYFDTGLAQKAEQTFVAAFYASPAGGLIVMGTGVPGDPAHWRTQITYDNTQTGEWRVSLADGSFLQVPATLNWGVNAIAIGRMKNDGEGGSVATFTVYQGGVKSESSVSGAAEVRILGRDIAFRNISGDDVRLFRGAVYDRYVSDDEVSIIHEFLRQQLSQEGIAI